MTRNPRDLDPSVARLFGVKAPPAPRAPKEPRSFAPKSRGSHDQQSWNHHLRHLSISEARK